MYKRQGKYDDISALLDYPITTQTGQQVALRDISTVEYITTLPIITRQEGQYSVTLTATTTDSAKYSAPKEIDARTAQLDLPQGVSFGVGMMDESTAEGLESMATAIAAGIFLVFQMCIRDRPGRRQCGRSPTMRPAWRPPRRPAGPVSYTHLCGFR